MELGRVAEIDSAKVNAATKAQKVKETDDGQKIDPNEQHKKVLSKEANTQNEVMLDNVSFGYNKETKDFFVKVKRGGIENKYPTDDMMKLKASLLQAMDSDKS